MKKLIRYCFLFDFRLRVSSALEGSVNRSMAKTGERTDGYVTSRGRREARMLATWSSRRLRRNSRKAEIRHSRASRYSRSFSDKDLSSLSGLTSGTDGDDDDDDCCSFAMLSRSNSSCCWRRLSAFSRRAFYKRISE